MSDRKKNLPAKTILLMLLAVAAASLLFYFRIHQKEEGKTAAIPLGQERQQQEKAQAQNKGTAQRGEAALTPPAGSPTIQGALAGKPGTEAVAKAPQAPCQQAIATLDGFFSHLDQEQYITELRLAGGSKVYFTSIITKLQASKPSVIRETDNLLTVLHNMAHFYRVLGKRNIDILKKIMANEKASYEPVMAAFYQLVTSRECRQANYPIQLSMEDMYTYSTFFLNTLGGQAYLQRRDPGLRVLVKYYCILALDQANLKKANHLGIDIKYPLNNLVEELSATTGLQDKERYLNTLFGLQDKYDKLYGN